VANRFRRRFEIPEDDVGRLMNCIVEHARADEARAVERLLGTLATLAARPSGGRPVTFSAPPGTATLVERALEAMARSDRHHERSLRFGPPA
jgi:hypothetical protein